MTTTPYYADEQVTLHIGDALDVLPTLPAASIDAIVTDPPYGLEFMGKDWDAPWKTGDGFRRSRNGDDAGRDDPFGRASRTSPEFIAGVGFQRWCLLWAGECLRVLKPGGHMLAFGGSRTYHRLAVAIEDAGFEVRDSIAWTYGSGFPKSLNLVDGAGERTGWGTALKPAFEPIAVARKPLIGTVAANVARHSTGALNIDGCRVGAMTRTNHAGGSSSLQRVSRVEHGYRNTVTTSTGESSEVVGRWPANVVLTHQPLLDADGQPVGDACSDGCVPGCPVAEMDRQSGIRTSGTGAVRTKTGTFLEHGGLGKAGDVQVTYGDSGGASRYFPAFRYEAKAPASERPRLADGTAHPTVKPLALMRWLVRLVTPPGGLVLDPFAGSGTTLQAAVAEGMRAIGIEQHQPYADLAAARLSQPIALDLFGGTAS